MSMTEHSARADHLESLPEHVVSFVLDDGSIFFFHSGSPQRLFGWGKNGRRLDCSLSRGLPLKCAGVAGSSLYFYSQSNNKAGDTMRFYRATIDDQGEKIEFTKTYERRFTNESIIFAIDQPFYQRMSAIRKGIFEVYDFENKDKSYVFSGQLSEVFADSCKESEMFILHKDHIYLLSDDRKHDVHRVSNYPHSIILVSLPNLNSVACLAREGLDFLYILHEKTILLIRSATLSYKLSIEIEEMALHSSRSIAGFHKEYLYLNVMDYGTFDRYRVRLLARFRSSVGKSKQTTGGSAKTGKDSGILPEYSSWCDTEAECESITARRTTNNAHKLDSGTSKSVETRKPRVTLKKTEISRGSTVDGQVGISTAKSEVSSKFMTDFKFIKELDERALRVVYEVEHNLDKSKYAVKRVPIQQIDEKVLCEVYAMAKIQHPGIVRYYHSWKEEPAGGQNGLFKNFTFIYIQMELCESSLEKWLASNKGRRDLGRMKEWLKQLLKAVDYIHSKGIFHRDLKPANILFDKNQRLKICDLGLAAFFKTGPNGKELTNTRTMGVGTEEYMSPDQGYWLYKSTVDVFALGLIFAEMVVVMPNDQKSKIFDNYRSGKPNDILKDVPDTAKFVEWMTTIDPDKRPSCHELLNSYFFPH